LSRYLNQETAKGFFWSSSQAVTCYYQFNHSKVEANPLSALLKDTTSKLPTYIFTVNSETEKCEEMTIKKLRTNNPLFGLFSRGSRERGKSCNKL